MMLIVYFGIGLAILCAVVLWTMLNVAAREP
jgi:hypothetical protein